MIPWPKGELHHDDQDQQRVEAGQVHVHTGVIGEGERIESTNFGTFIEHSEMIGS